MASIGKSHFLRIATLALGLLCAPPAIAETLTKQQSDAQDTYNNARTRFEQMLRQRRAQINAKQALPNLPGQALYLARNTMMSTYKDLTDALPSRIGRPNKFGIPPAYFDADIEPLIDEYPRCSSVMQAPPANAQNSATPFKDVADLGTAIARAKGLDAADCRSGGPHQPRAVLRRDQRQPEHRQCALQQIQGQPADRRRPKITTASGSGRRSSSRSRRFDPALIARDDKEEARVGNRDQRYNHWTAVRNGLMNAHADIFRADAGDREDAAGPDRPDEAVRTDPDHSERRPSALGPRNLTGYRISDPTIMGYLRNNSMFTFGQADRAKTSATFREILDAMWLFNEKFERALARYDEIRKQRKS